MSCEEGAICLIGMSMSSSAAEGKDVAQDGRAIADMDQCAASIPPASAARLMERPDCSRSSDWVVLPRGLEDQERLGRREKLEDIITKLRSVAVLQCQGMSEAEPVRQIGVTQQTCSGGAISTAA
jgi:hypothetical protein